MPKEKHKIWELLVERGLARDKANAESLLMSGSVLVEDQPVTKLGLIFPKDANIRIRQKIPDYVSRGAQKIKPILEKWNISVDDVVCIDLGASTGGFTQVLLEKGARNVYAVDVGYGQLAGKIQNNPKVIVMDRTHFKDLKYENFSNLEQEVFISMDLSFTSLLPALQKVHDLFSEKIVRVSGLSLLKPQFEAKESELEKGIVKNNNLRFHIIKRTMREIRKIRNIKIIKFTNSPIKGMEGNIEYFIYWKLL